MKKRKKKTGGLLRQCQMIFPTLLFLFSDFSNFLHLVTCILVIELEKITEVLHVFYVFFLSFFFDKEICLMP
jgi:hypothetical protein